MILKLFYIFKPFIPRRLQLYIRRKIVYIKLDKYKSIWPILEGSEKKPAKFLGWPEDKTFAIILTHDVEHKNGYNKVLKLMELEKKLGFVSGFYFVPERDYIIEKDLYDAIKKNGFEFGIQGLKHDGKYFKSEKTFLKRAKKINEYLRKWDAVGFRTPAMLHNLDLIGALDILYDLSTFDTDPFEPQPDGVGTIFPFWVENQRHKNGGFVEMPYTLPQDFTPFILMKEKTPKIWTDKLDWIAENNGMALINVHPDYLNFDGIKKGQEEFDIAIYKQFLMHIINNYYNKYWNPLPRDLSIFWKKNFIVK